jgi:diguanylate cyclase (GGDEF)-like protein/PAS domain S-box-containing protein
MLVSVPSRIWSFLRRKLHLGGTNPVTSTLSKTEQTLISHLSNIVVKGFAHPTPGFGRTAPVILDMAFASRLTQGEAHSNRASAGSESSPSHRSRRLRALFVHRDADAIDACVQELEKAQFTVSSDCVLNLAQCEEQLRSSSYDVMIVEYLGSHCNGSQVLQLLNQSLQEIAVIFLTPGRRSESIEELTAEGSFEYVERENIAHLPMVVRRALNHKELRKELAEAKKALQHSQSLYRALEDNPTYGIYRCGAEGKLLDVNQTLVTMLGYASKEQLLAANQDSDIIPNFRDDSLSAGRVPERRIEPLEMEWKRKDGTKLKARLSGRGVYDDHGNFAGHEIIVVDITEQRTLEDHLRHQALSDSLTGLGNHRRLFEVLHAEICRTKRTGREFSLLLLDLDGLKSINDQFGHAVGSRALCRLAEIVADCCRSGDTPARHGGDEFALVLPETGPTSAALVGQRICELLAKDSESPRLSVSVGVAGYPQDADTIGTLLYAADRALYAMKARKPASPLSAHSPYSFSKDPNAEFHENRE